MRCLDPAPGTDRKRLKAVLSPCTRTPKRGTRRDTCSIMPPAAEASPSDTPSCCMPNEKRGCRRNKTRLRPRARIHGQATIVRMRSEFRHRVLLGTCPGSPGCQVSLVWTWRSIPANHYSGPMTSYISIPTRLQDDPPLLQVDSALSAKNYDTVGENYTIRFQNSCIQAGVPASVRGGCPRLPTSDPVHHCLAVRFVASGQSAPEIGQWIASRARIPKSVLHRL